MGANQLDERVLDGAGRIALAVRLDVAQVADMALRVRRRAVRLAVGIDWAISVPCDKHSRRTHSASQSTRSRWWCRQMHARACRARR